MRLRGVCYDVGRVIGGLSTRPVFDPRVVHRELEIIRHDLHCNAVRICGSDIDRVTTAAEEALHQGLEVWFTPELFEHGQNETLEYIVSAARSAEKLRRNWPGQVVLSVGTELTIFMQGILAGDHFAERIAAASFGAHITSGAHNAPLNAFLAKATELVRSLFEGPVTYASAPFEAVDWSIFDVVCVDLYRDARISTTFANVLGPYFGHQRPVVISEVGCCTYRGAEDAGGMGWAIVDYTKTPLRLDDDYERDETLQARELAGQLDLLDSQGIDGAFVMTFVSPILTHHDDRRSDLDMSSYSLVKSYANRTGTTYPDMPWEPKQSFKALAEYFVAGQREQRLSSAP